MIAHLIVVRLAGLLAALGGHAQGGARRRPRGGLAAPLVDDDAGVALVLLGGRRQGNEK